MGTTVFTGDLGPMHKQRVIIMQFHILTIYRIIKTRPACTGFKFCVRREKCLAASGTFVNTFCMIIAKCSCKRTLGAFLPQDAILFGGKLFFPVGLWHIA